MSAARCDDDTVYIGENADPDDLMLWTGRFRGYLDRGRRCEAEFDDLSAEDAIAWGRARCAVVLIRLGDGDYYSAGELNPDPDELPEWPPEGLRLERRRVRGFEALDNTEDDPPVLWDVRIGATGIEAGSEDDARAFHDAIRADPDAISVQAPAPGYPAMSAAFVVQASTLDQARRIADRVARRAGDAFIASLAQHPRHAQYGPFVEVYPHRPGDPVRGFGITY